MRYPMPTVRIRIIDNFSHLSSGAKKTVAAIRNFLSFLQVASVDRPVLEGALEDIYEDFEDGVFAEAARRSL